MLDQLECPTLNLRPEAHSIAVVPSGKSIKDAVLQEAKRRLGSLAYVELRNIVCEYHDGLLILTGKVSSYYLKQLAQESLRSQPDVEAMMNKMEVESRPMSLSNYD